MKIKDDARLKTAVKELPVVGKICYYTGILDIWFEENPCKGYKPFQCEKVNPWNPLTYLAIVILMVINLISITYNSCKEYWKEEVVDVFKTRRH
jgi:hypothetical protein